MIPPVTMTEDRFGFTETTIFSLWWQRINSNQRVVVGRYFLSPYGAAQYKQTSWTWQKSSIKMVELIYCTFRVDNWRLDRGSEAFEDGVIFQPEDKKQSLPWRLLDDMPEEERTLYRVDWQLMGHPMDWLGNFK